MSEPKTTGLPPDAGAHNQPHQQLTFIHRTKDTDDTMNLICDDPVKQQCRRCHGWFDQEAGFRKKNDRRRLHISSREFHNVCIPCEQTARDIAKATDNFAVKARSTIRRHATRYGLPAKDFIRRFGWDVPRVRHLLAHAFDNTCEYCRLPYAAMRNGVWDVTVDIVDPKSPPYLETNTKVCCQTCNREKANTSPQLWARKLRVYAAWREHQKTRTPPAEQLLLELPDLFRKAA